MDFNALLKGQKTDYVQTLPEMEDASMQVVAGERLRRFTQINYSLSSTISLILPKKWIAIRV